MGFSLLYNVTHSVGAASLAAFVLAGPAEPGSRLPRGTGGISGASSTPRATSRAPAAGLRAGRCAGCPDTQAGEGVCAGQVCSASFLGFGAEQPACAQQIINGAPALARTHRQRGQRAERVRDRRTHRLVMRRWWSRALPSRGQRLRGEHGAPGETGLDSLTGSTRDGRERGRPGGCRQARGLVSLRADGRVGRRPGLLGHGAEKVQRRLVQPPWFAWLMEKGFSPHSQSRVPNESQLSHTIPKQLLPRQPHGAGVRGVMLQSTHTACV